MMTCNANNHVKATRKRWDNSKPPTVDALRAWNAVLDMFGAIPKGDTLFGEALCGLVLDHIRNGTVPGPEDRRKVEQMCAE